MYHSRNCIGNFPRRHPGKFSNRDSRTLLQMGKTDHEKIFIGQTLLWALQAHTFECTKKDVESNRIQGYITKY